MPVLIEKIGCMVPTAHSTCKRPVVFIFYGVSGAFYRCVKHGNELLTQRDDIRVADLTSRIRSDG